MMESTIVKRQCATHPTCCYVEMVKGMMIFLATYLLLLAAFTTTTVGVALIPHSSIAVHCRQSMAEVHAKGEMAKVEAAMQKAIQPTGTVTNCC